MGATSKLANMESGAKLQNTQMLNGNVNTVAETVGANMELKNGGTRSVESRLSRIGESVNIQSVASADSANPASYKRL